MASPGISEPGLRKKFNFVLIIVFSLLCVLPFTSSGYITYSTCPGSCRCSNIFLWKTFANCSRRSLTEVPQSFNGNFNKICLAYNRIDEIRENDFSTPINVEIVNLRYNVITNIHEKAFEKLKELRTLDLSCNRITTLPSRLFEKNSKFKTLLLRSNMLSVTGPIVNSLSLKKLDISSCSIYYLPCNSFESVPNLNTLYLDDNPLIGLSVNTVETLKELQSIRMEPKKSICLQKSFQNVIQYFQNKSVDHFPKIICGLDYICYINTADKSKGVSEIFVRKEQRNNHSFVEHSLFIIFACVFVGGVLCVLFIYKCPIRRKITSPNANSEMQRSTFFSGDDDVKPWYKMLLFRVSGHRKENKESNTVRHGNQ